MGEGENHRGFGCWSGPSIDGQPAFRAYDTASVNETAAKSIYYDGNLSYLSGQCLNPRANNMIGSLRV